MNERQHSPSTPADSRLGNWLLILGVLVLPLGIAAVATWDEVRTRQVESVQPIGALQRMGTTGGWDGKVVVETEQGFYPLDAAITLAKGTGLTLETRRSGRRYVCDVARTLCVQTTRNGFAPGARRPS